MFYGAHTKANMDKIGKQRNVERYLLKTKLRGQKENQWIDTPENKSQVYYRRGRLTLLKAKGRQVEHIITNLEIMDSEAT